MDSNIYNLNVYAFQLNYLIYLKFNFFKENKGFEEVLKCHDKLLKACICRVLFSCCFGTMGVNVGCDDSIIWLMLCCVVLENINQNVGDQEI